MKKYVHTYKETAAMLNSYPLSLLGACVGCMSIDDTIQGGIEAILLDEVEGVSGVALIE